MMYPHHIKCFRHKRAESYLKMPNRPIISIEFQTVGRKRAAQGTHPCAAHISALIVSGQVAFYYPPAIALAVFPGENALLLQSYCYAFDSSERLSYFLR